MQITNIHGLPQQFVDLAEQEYIQAPNEYRVTQLLKGLRETLLIRRHQDEITVDVSDMVWLLFGTAVHDVLERRQESATELKEERLKLQFGNYTLSGKFDLYCAEQQELTDYKTASVWKIIYGDYDDWRRQQLMYAVMLADLGYSVTKGRVVAFLKDHSKNKARFDANYPDLPVQSVRFNFTGEDIKTTDDWLIQQFLLIAELEKLSDNDLPICTPEERWNSGDQWAVMKKGRKSALRVLDSQDKAAQWMIDNNKGDHIEHRPGIDRKCMDYCYAAPFCDYYKETYGRVKG